MNQKPACREVEEQLTPFVDGELPADRAETVRAHLAACPPCRAAERTERTGRKILQDRSETICGKASAALCAAVRKILPERRR
jgi:anti-sigma factor (TIGR02949 family)